MNKIMDVPKCYYRDLNSCYKTKYTGQQVLDKFYNVGVLKENYIPKALKDNNWIPDSTKKYICYWYSTNPTYTSDFGCDILFYIEELVEKHESEKVFVSTGCKAITDERTRQVQVEHYDAEHDKNESIENLVWAAFTYATVRREYWPWDLNFYKPGELNVNGIRKDLVKAGALIAAAIDKIDRGETEELK